MSNYIERRAAIEVVNHAFDRETLLSSFVRKVAISALKRLPSADALPYSIDPDGTLTITVPKGTTVTRVLVQEDGTQWGGLFYAD